ncbi:Uncharacterised protein [uncultured Clostridium sp.]|nr:Uncharacterised protein [uncultured Clostridium sp.]
MNRIHNLVLEHIKKNKYENVIEIKLHINEFNELEKNRTEFCHEVGKIMGNCRMDVETESNNFKILIIEKVADWVII